MNSTFNINSAFWIQAFVLSDHRFFTLITEGFATSPPQMAAFDERYAAAVTTFWNHTFVSFTSPLMLASGGRRVYPCF